MGVRFIGYGASRQTLTQLVGVKNFCDGEKFDFFLVGNKISVVWRKFGFLAGFWLSTAFKYVLCVLVRVDKKQALRREINEFLKNDVEKWKEKRDYLT